MDKKSKNRLIKAFKMSLFLAMVAGIVWINTLKLQDDTLSNYEKITDTATKDYYHTTVTPVIAALFYEEENAGYGQYTKQNTSGKNKENIRMAVIPKEINSFNRPVINKLYEEIPNRNKVRELIFVYVEEKNVKSHTILIKTKFSNARIKKVKVDKDHELKEKEIEGYLSDSSKLVVFLANLDRGLNTAKSDRLANEAIFFAQKNTYQMNVFDVVDEYIATALAAGENYVYDLNRAGDSNSLAKQKENLDGFVVRYRDELLHYFIRNLELAMQKKKVEIPEKTNKNYRLFDRGAVYIKVYNQNYVQVFEELKLNQDESIISIVANAAKHIVNSSHGLSGKFFHIYFLTEMKEINGKIEDVLLKYVEPDDGIYMSHRKQAGLLLPSDRPSDVKGIINKLRSVAQIRENVKNGDLSFYRFKYAEIQYEH